MKVKTLITDLDKLYTLGHELATALQTIGFVADTIGVGNESWTPEFDVTETGVLPIILDDRIHPLGWARGVDRDRRSVSVVVVRYDFNQRDGAAAIRYIDTA